VKRGLETFAYLPAVFILQYNNNQAGLLKQKSPHQKIPMAVATIGEHSSQFWERKTGAANTRSGSSRNQPAPGRVLS
jgi:hypothetical protein